MRLVPVMPSRQGGFYYPCVVCGKLHPETMTFADLDGPAFQAYVGAGGCREQYELLNGKLPNAHDSIRLDCKCVNCGHPTHADHPDLCCRCLQIAFGPKEHEQEHSHARRS